MADPTPAEQARIDQLDAAARDAGVDVSFAVLTNDEVIAEIAAREAAVFVPAAEFLMYDCGGHVGVIPAAEVDGLDYIRERVLAGDLGCRHHGIGNQLGEPGGMVDVPMFAHFRLVIDRSDVPLYIWIDKAPEEWLVRAMSRFAVVWPELEDGRRPWLASGPMRTLPPGFVMPPKLGRNDVCPCGSGMKFKRCHGS